MIYLSFKMSGRNTNKNVRVSTLSRSEKEEIGSLVIKAEPIRQELLAQLNDNACSERNIDEQTQRVEIDGYMYLSQHASLESSLIAKYSANPFFGKIRLQFYLPNVNSNLLRCFLACRQDQRLSNAVA